MALSPTDHAELAAAARDAATARGAAEAAAATLGPIATQVGNLADALAKVLALLAQVRNETAPQLVFEKDHPQGVVWIVFGAGAGKTWVQSGDQYAALRNAFPSLTVGTWNPENLAAIPTFGPTPPVDLSE